MPSLTLFNMNGQEVGNIELNESIFGIKEINSALLHQSVVNYLANQRQGTQSTKTRGEVRGGGKKPWKQKGTGRARQGSIRASQWVHGGVALGPKPRSYKYLLPRKMRRAALLNALSSKTLDSAIVVVDKIELAEIKTKGMIEVLSSLKLNGKVEIERPVVSKKGDKPKFRDERVLVILPESEEKVLRSAHNIPTVNVSYPNTLNAYEVLYYDKILLTLDALKKVEEVYA